MELYILSEHLNPMSILVVEDEEGIRKKIVEYLNIQYKNIYEASNEKDAYKIYNEKKPNLLLVDINLTHGNGLNFLRTVRKKDQQTKAIVVSAYSEVEYLMEAIDLKLTQYLVKPVERKSLKDALDLAQEEIKTYSITRNEIITLDSDYVWDKEKDTLLFHNEQVTLGSKEHKLLKLLLSNLHKVFDYDEISYELWDYEPADKLNSIKIIIKKLRAKLPKGIIQNEYGIGYSIKI